MHSFKFQNENSCTKLILYNAIDWRGKVSPNSSYLCGNNQRFSVSVFSDHSYLKYNNQQKPILNTALSKSVKTRKFLKVHEIEEHSLKKSLLSRSELILSNKIDNLSTELHDDLVEVAAIVSKISQLNLSQDDLRVNDQAIEQEKINGSLLSAQAMVSDVTLSACLPEAESTASNNQSSDDKLLSQARTVSASVVKSKCPTFGCSRNAIKTPQLTPPKRSASSIPTLYDRRCLFHRETVAAATATVSTKKFESDLLHQTRFLNQSTQCLPNGTPVKRKFMSKDDSGKIVISCQQRNNNCDEPFLQQLIVRPTRNAFSAVVTRRDEFKRCTRKQVSSRPATSNTCTAARQAKERMKSAQRPISCTLHVPDTSSTSPPVKVEISKLFRARNPTSKSYLKKLERSEVEKREDERKAALLIQRNYRLHLQRRREIARRAPSAENLAWSKFYDQTILEHETSRQDRMLESVRVKSAQNLRFNKKLMIVGPHVEIFSNFHPARNGPSQREKHSAALIIQKAFRGWLTRHRLKALHRKARYHGTKLADFLTYYFSLMRRIQRRAGIRHPVTRFAMKEIDEFMDAKKKYEVAFESRAFCDILECKELKNLFRDCHLCPASVEINTAMDLLFGSSRNIAKLNKEDVLELIFTIYKPSGSGLSGLRRSTWMHPIIDQEDAIKHLGPDEMVNTPLSKCLSMLMEVNKNNFDLDKQISIRRHIKQLEEAECRQKSVALMSKKDNAQTNFSKKVACIKWFK